MFTKFDVHVLLLTFFAFFVKIGLLLVFCLLFLNIFGDSVNRLLLTLGGGTTCQHELIESLLSLLLSIMKAVKLLVFTQFWFNLCCYYNYRRFLFLKYF